MEGREDDSVGPLLIVPGPKAGCEHCLSPQHSGSWTVLHAPSPHSSQRGSQTETLPAGARRLPPGLSDLKPGVPCLVCPL